MFSFQFYIEYRNHHHHKMDKRLHWLFCLIYIVITMITWYAGYHAYCIRGIYQGPIPEQATDELIRYIYHPLMGLCK